MTPEDIPPIIRQFASYSDEAVSHASPLAQIIARVCREIVAEAKQGVSLEQGRQKQEQEDKKQESIILE